jgi:protein O-mannosyl-transferase
MLSGKTLFMNSSKQPLAAQGRRNAVLCCSLIACATFIVFLPSLNNDFTNWDDGSYVVVNPDIQGFTFHNLARIFSSGYVNNYQPLTMLTYMAEYSFFKLNPVVYHSTNLVLHIINGVLVFVLIYALSGSHVTGLLVGLLFAVHPMRVESVAWISERKDVLSAFFYFISLLFYLRYINKNKRKYYWLCALSLLFSLLSKPMAVSQPFVLLLIDYFSNKKVDKKAVLDKIPFFAISAVFIAITLIAQLSGPEPDSSHFSPVQRIFAPFYGIVFYLVKSVFPANLCAFYPFPVTPDGGMPLRLLASPFPVLGIAAAVWYFRGRSRTLVFGSLFFLVAALPVLQIVPVGSAIVAERYTYVPLLGVYFVFAGFFRYLLTVKFAGNNAAKGLLAAGIGIYGAVFCCLTYGRCGVWKDSLSLWNDVISKHPFAEAYNNRGKFYSAQGDNVRALDDFNRAISLKPAFALPYYNRAIVYRSRGDYDRAIDDNTRAIMYNPGFSWAYNDRGVACCLKGEYDRGIADFTQAVTLDPEYAEAYFNRGFAYEKKNDYARASEDYKRACALGDDLACQRLRGN